MYTNNELEYTGMGLKYVAYTFNIIYISENKECLHVHDIDWQSHYTYALNSSTIRHSTVKWISIPAIIEILGYCNP